MLIRLVPVALVGALSLGMQAVPVAASDVLEGRAAIESLVGRTMVSTVLEHADDFQEGLMFLRADGTAAWVNIEKGAKAHNVDWTIDDRSRLCLSSFPDNASRKECGHVEVEGERVRLSDGDTSSDAHMTIRVVSGNPYGL